MTPKPMPVHPNEDPAHLAARESKARFTEQSKAVRGNFDLSDLAKAEHLEVLYETHLAELENAFIELTDRRRTRLTYLEDLVPVGPGIPDGTSAADRAVLMTAFRGAYATAQGAGGRPERERLLAEAERFDDDAMRRAVLTVAIDSGETELLRAWSEQHVETSRYMEEVAKLRNLLGGLGASTELAFQGQDFRPERKPAELNDLPVLRAARDAAHAGH